MNEFVLAAILMAVGMLAGVFSSGIGYLGAYLEAKTKEREALEKGEKLPERKAIFDRHLFFLSIATSGAIGAVTALTLIGTTGSLIESLSLNELIVVFLSIFTTKTTISKLSK